MEFVRYTLRQARGLSPFGQLVFASITLFKQGVWIPFIPSAFAVIASGVVVLFVQCSREFPTLVEESVQNPRKLDETR